MLAEIASRALSPAVNDPGTAIDVLSRAMRILAVWAETQPEPPQKPEHPRLHVAPIELCDLFDDLFTPIARDGAGLVEVGLRLQKALVSLSHFDGPEFRENALRHSHEALKRADAVLHIEADKERLYSAALGSKPDRTETLS